MQPAEIRLQAIQSMLIAGQRSVHIERHSLLIWGVTGGMLSMLTGDVLSAQRIPSNSLRALAVLLWLSFWIASAAMLDHHLTRRARQARDEVVPFAQAQITRAWWMLLGMGILGTFAMFFYGGAPMLFTLWMVLLGMGIYLFGLFSKSLIEWIGIATILFGIAALAAGLPQPSARWLAASCFAIGLPFAGLLVQRLDTDGLGSRLMALCLWLVIVAGPALLAGMVSDAVPPPAGKAVTLESFHPMPQEQVLHLPAGTMIGVQLELDSPVLSLASAHATSVVLRQPIQVTTFGGEPDGRYQLDDQPWHRVTDGLLQLRLDRIQARLEGDHPVLRIHASFQASRSARWGR